MSSEVQQPALSVREFVPLVAMIVSLGALAIDAMLPAIHPMARDLGATDPNEAQLIVSVMFLGFALGQLIYGPLSDGVGRKPAIYLGIGLFLVGCGLSVIAETFELLLVGRLIQGTGSAATRIVSVALIRDQYVGEAMARVMSLVMGVFVFVPAVAPALGQGVLLVAGWRMIFLVLAGQALVSVTWLAVRQPETLPLERRRSLSPGGLLLDAREVFQQRSTVLYTLALALVFGNLVGYLTTAPQIFEDLYGVVEGFPLYFAMTACSIGLGSFLNSGFVERYGARRVSLRVLAFLAIWSGLFVVFAFHRDGHPALWELMTYLLGAFFCLGPLMGNLNALAMGPVGHIAGTAAAVVGAFSTAVSLTCGSVIGQSYAGTVVPLGLGFFVLGTSAWVSTWVAQESVSSRTSSD